MSNEQQLSTLLTTHFFNEQERATFWELKKSKSSSREYFDKIWRNCKVVQGTSEVLNNFEEILRE